MSTTVDTSKATATEEIVLGGADSFMTVRHLTIRGSNLEIGRIIGKMVVERYPRPTETFASTPLYARARPRYFQQHYPIHWMRMQGAASAFGVDPEDDRYDVSGLMYRIDLPPGPSMGCSVAYFPPSTTTAGSGYLSRNYDFSIGSIADVFGLPVPAEVKAHLRPLMGEPYIMEWYPTDGGYASIAIHNFDLLSGAMDGINSAGLAVSILADDEAIALLGPRLEPHLGAAKAIGVHELQLMRLLLDTCATAEEAKDTLFEVKEFYAFAPLHYIVADRAGRSFIFENSTGRNGQYVFEVKGAPQFVTNFELYRHGGSGPEFEAPLTLQTNAFWRYQKMSELIAGRGGKFGLDDLKSISAAVSAPEFFSQAAPGPDGKPLVRTLWHSIYDQTDGTAEFSFYIGDDNRNGELVARRSAYRKFALTPVTAQ